MKSYKRELATFSLTVLYIFVGYTLYTLSSLGHTDSMVDLVGVLVIPTFAIIAAAFGIDSYFKQNPRTGAPNNLPDSSVETVETDKK